MNFHNDMDPINTHTRYNFQDHPEPWKNDLARQLNDALYLAGWAKTNGYDLERLQSLLSVVARIAVYEGINKLQ